MLRSITELTRFSLGSDASTTGYVKDFLVDDQAWRLRYAVLDVGVWLTNRKVLVSVTALGEPDWESRSFPSAVTKDQIRNGPPMNLNQPISRDSESTFNRHYGYPDYWKDSAITGTAPAALRSCRSLQGQEVGTGAGTRGRIQDCLVDVGSWTIRQFVVTSGASGAQQLLITPASSTKGAMDHETVGKLTATSGL